MHGLTLSPWKRSEAKARLAQMAAAGCNPSSAVVQGAWTYDQSAFYQGVRDFDLATSFTGSYNVRVDIDCRECLLKFKVTNTSGWASGTRLRKAATPGGIHQSVIDDRQRGDPGVALGGNISEEWKWEEKAK